MVGPLSLISRGGAQCNDPEVNPTDVPRFSTQLRSQDRPSSRNPGKLLSAFNWCGRVDCVPRSSALTFEEVLFRLRGGGGSDDESDSDSGDVGSDDGDDDNFGDVSAADFEGEDTLGRRLKSAVEKTPPITQGFLTVSIAITALSCVLNHNRFPDFLMLDWSRVARGEIWRLLTNFLYFGPLDISFALTMQFVWQYMSQLEKVHHKEPGKFVIMWLTGAASLLAAFAATNIPTANLGHNLSCFLVYVWARTYEGHEINFMELFTMRSELMPWFLALQTFLLEGEFPIMDLVGIAAGHLYYVLYSTKRYKPL